MKVLIFENQFDELEPLFETLKEDYKDFDYDYLANSQALRPFERINEYDKILVDLKLSDRTQLEGYDIIKRMISIGYDRTKIAIITGHTDYKTKLSTNNLSDIKVIEKPVYFDEIESFLGLK